MTITAVLPDSFVNLTPDTRSVSAAARKYVIGVDIGNQGGIAILASEGDLIDAIEMPCLQDGPNNRPTVSAALLAAIIRKSRASMAFVEHVAARPGEGPTGAFAFGRSRGVVEGCLGSYSIPVSFLTPARWKRLVGIAPGAAGAKDAARSLAIRHWPAKASLFALKKSDGLAEAALIGLAGLRRPRPSAPKVFVAHGRDGTEQQILVIATTARTARSRIRRPISARRARPKRRPGDRRPRAKAPPIDNFGRRRVVGRAGCLSRRRPVISCHFQM